MEFIDSARFMTSSLSNLVNNLSEEIHKTKCKYGHDDKKCETCVIKCKYCDCFLEYLIFKDDLRGYKCLCYNENYQHKFDENLKEQFINNTNFLNTTAISSFCCCEKVLILMNKWMIGKNDSKHHHLKKYFYSHLNMEDTTDADYAHSKRVCKDFEPKNLGEY